MLERFREQFKVEQDNIHELERKCDELRDEKTEYLGGFFAADILLREKEEILKSARERISNIQNNINSLLDT